MSADGLFPFHEHKQSAYRGQRWLCSTVSCFLLCLSSESVTEVRTNIYVTSFGPVSDTDMVSVSPPTPTHLESHVNRNGESQKFGHGHKKVSCRVEFFRGFTCKSDGCLETTDRNILG